MIQRQNREGLVLSSLCILLVYFFFFTNSSPLFPCHGLLNHLGPRHDFWVIILILTASLGFLGWSNFSGWLHSWHLLPYIKREPRFFHCIRTVLLWPDLFNCWAKWKRVFQAEEITQGNWRTNKVLGLTALVWRRALRLLLSASLVALCHRLKLLSK